MDHPYKRNYTSIPDTHYSSYRQFKKMEDLTIPGWFIVLAGVIGGSFFSWAVWITAKVNNNDKDIALNTLADTTVKEKIKEVKENIAEVKEDLNGRMDKMEKHFDGKFDQVFKRISEIKK